MRHIQIEQRVTKSKALLHAGIEVDRNGKTRQQQQHTKHGETYE